MNKIKILALMGEAGAGKDYILQEMLNAHPEFYEIISCTSRPIRENEINGVNYHYYSKEEFEQKIVNNEMFEYTEFNNWYYGTGKNSLDKRYINVGVFNPEGVRTLINHPMVDVFVVWVQANDKTRLLRQLNRESSPDVDEIVRRYQTDKQDFSNIKFPYITVRNEDCDWAWIVCQNIYAQLGDWAKVANK